ncbi:hypothetical protein AAG906_035893 [Vitis piasezkii]
MKAKIAAMVRRLEELEMKKMQEVQAISQTPLQVMSCAICLSYEHLVDECPTSPAVREMFAPQQASNLEQAMMNLNKVMEDFVEAQKSINAQLSQRISLPDRVESSLNKKMDGVQHDLSQKIDNLQDSISRFANLNTMQEKENSPSQPHQNQKDIHEMEAKEGDKEVDLPTCKLEHKEEKDSHQGRNEETHPSTFPPRFVWQYHTKQVSSEGCKLHMGSGQAKSGSNFLMDLESIASNGPRFGVETKKLWPFEDDCAKLNGNVAAAPISLLLDTFLEHFLELKLCIPYLQLRAPVEKTMPSKENTRTEAKFLIQPTQKATTDASAPQDLTII